MSQTISRRVPQGGAGFRTTPLTPEHWGDLEDLFGPQGACYGCWCIHFWRPPKERKEGRPLMRLAL